MVDIVKAMIYPDFTNASTRERHLSEQKTKPTVRKSFDFNGFTFHRLYPGYIVVLTGLEPVTPSM